MYQAASKFFSRVLCCAEAGRASGGGAAALAVRQAEGRRLMIYISLLFQGMWNTCTKNEIKEDTDEDETTTRVETGKDG